MSAYLDRPASQRAVSLGVVALLHAAVLAIVLASSGAVTSALTVLSPVQVLPPESAKPPLPPPVLPKLQLPDLLPVPAPEIVVAAPAGPRNAPAAIVRVAPRGPAIAHFGPAGSDTGLGLSLATAGTGGARGRGSLEDFEAAVKRAILARKVQPSLAWDRRNTCVVNYTASVAPNGSLVGYHIDPCAIPEINEAARAAIREAAPFPHPPDLGGASTDVHGTLIFHP